MPEDTWETAISGTPADETSATAEVDTTADTSTDATQTLEAQAETLETDDSQLEVESAARESESQTEQATEEDEDVQEGDTPEILALPSGSAARKWARRQFHDAEPTRKFLNFGEPISTFSEDLLQRSESRYGELVDDIVNHHYDLISQKLFGLPYEEAKGQLTGNANAQTDTQTTQQPTDGQEFFTATELEDMPVEFAERLREFQQKQADTEAQLKSQNEALQKRLDALEGKFTTKEQAEQQRLLETQQVEAAKIGNDLYTSVWSVVEEEIRNSGLEISKDDPPRIASLKQAALDLLSKERVESAFDNDPEQGEENRKLVESVMLAASRGERQVAFREEDNLKVRARAAFAKVKQSPQVQAILSEIANSKSNTKRGIPPPPVPGAPAGVLPKQPKTWDEAVAG